MTTKLADLDEYFSPGLTLTVRGKEYVVPLASAELGLWCRAIATATGEITAASTEAEIRDAVARVESLPQLDGEMSLAQRLLGTTYAEMTADDVPDVYIEFCAATAYIWIIAGEDQAAAYWQAGGRPEAHRPGNRASRRAASTGAKSTAAAAATPRRASTSGTRSPKTSGSRKTSR